MDANQIVSFDNDFVLEHENYDAFTNAEVDNYVTETVAKFNLTEGHVLSYFGPGGGWPWLQFTGTFANMLKLVAYYYGIEEYKDADDLLKQCNWESWDEALTVNN